jgi:hypothetical protein
MKIDQVRTFALSLPDVTESPHHHFSSFRVGGKIFITVPPDEEYLHIFVTEEKRDLAMLTAPEFAEKLFWGKKAVGLRICLAKAKPALVKQLITHAWEAKAPKSLLAKRPDVTKSHPQRP